MVPAALYPGRAVFGNAADAFGPVSLGAPLPFDPIHDRSGSGVLILQLLVEAHARGVADFSTAISDTIGAFIKAGATSGA